MPIVDEPPTILLLDDEADVIETARRSLPHSYSLLLARSAKEALASLEAAGGCASVLVADLQMPGMNGLKFLSQVGSEWPDLVRIALTTNADIAAALNVVNSGQVFQLLQKPISGDVLAAAVNKGIREHSRQQEHQRHAIIDELTGLGNRRAFDRAVSRVHARALRGVGRYGLLMIDIDEFKPYNDTLGRAAGNRVVSTVARALESGRRTSDEAFRYGGAEFVVLLADSSPEGMLIAAERHRAGIESLGITHPTTPSGVVTTSIGAGGFDAPAPRTWVDVLDSAITCLHEAKQAGRNCVRPAPSASAGRDCA